MHAWKWPELLEDTEGKEIMSSCENIQPRSLFLMVLESGVISGARNESDDILQMSANMRRCCSPPQCTGTVWRYVHFPSRPSSSLTQHKHLMNSSELICILTERTAASPSRISFRRVSWPPASAPSSTSLPHLSYALKIICFFSFHPAFHRVFLSSVPCISLSSACILSYC